MQKLDFTITELEDLEAPGFWEGLAGVTVGIGLGLGAAAIT